MTTRAHHPLRSGLQRRLHRRLRRSLLLLPAATCIAAILSACAAPGSVSGTAPQTDAIHALAPGGTLRVAVYVGSPTSLVRTAEGDRGISVELGKKLAHDLGVRYEQQTYSRLPDVLAAVRSGAADLTLTHATAARAQFLDFTRPAVSVELGYLVAASSPLHDADDLHKAGLRIGVSAGSTSQKTLPTLLPRAVIVAAPNLKAAGELLRTGAVDAIATNKGLLYELSDHLPGSRVLPGNWGVEHMAFAIPKGRGAGLTMLDQLVQQARYRQAIRVAAERAGMRGMAAEAKP